MKKKMPIYKAILFTLLSAVAFSQDNGDLKLWYNKPATVWNEALPLGNGRLGAMVFGNPVNEKLQLNESTFWSGGPSRNDNPDGPQVLDSIRYYIFKGDYKRAEVLSDKGLTAKKLHGSMFQSAGNLNLAFENASGFTDYYRELDIEKAVFTTTFKVNGTTYKREIFTSFPENVIVIKLTASKPGMLSFTAGFDGELQQYSGAIDATTLHMTGISGTHDGVEGKVKFDAKAKIINNGGQTSVEAGKIKVSRANEVTLLISVATNFTDYKTLDTDENKKSSSYLNAAVKKPYKKLLNSHIAAYQNYFNRVKFDLGSSAASKRPTDERIKNFAGTYDPSLISLYYQFGRYLLISSSQPGGQPANLQGIWNGSINPAWDSKYTININTEMNYWPAEKCNLPEMHEPLIQLIKELSESGRETARVMYKSGGWVAHHNTDIWRISGVVDFANAGQWPMGGAWLSQHLWEKYLYNGDTKYLESVYPVLKSASEFYKDFLIEEPTHKWLVVSPSISPENTPQNHQGSALAAGTTMDNQLVFDLFTKTIKAAQLLKKDPALAADLQRLADRLPPMQIGRYGQLQEWMGDWDNPEDTHRHVSHLYGLYPGNQISPYTTPQLFDAAKTVLVHRGDVSTGWSMGWKVNLWAHLLDGNHANKLIKDQLTLVDPVKPGHSGGTYPNMFDAHPPFQIDGNFGCTSGITEMLLQTQTGAIDILPALPDDWKDGAISGLRAFGGFEVSIVWKDNKAKQVSITSKLGGNCRLRLPNEVTLKGAALKTASGNNPNPFFEGVNIKQPLISPLATLNDIKLDKTFTYDFDTQAGKTYILDIKN
ncbi:glycosyl hydrolase family 95 catalytic domain-containing protein [Flavobacterium sp. RHBU_24]|uniref:glycoside hydrolase family 95 protein n=1 Tax=Flavobacterium sp. RHBU_24 TaxID=3391185 RepID=UPI0039854A02